MTRSDKNLDDEVKQAEAAAATATEAYGSLQTFFVNHIQLLKDYAELKSDCEEAKRSRDMYKNKMEKGEGTPFVLMLIDGDNYVFNDQFIKSHADGGARAAEGLHQQIVYNITGIDPKTRVMVRIYANVGKLSKMLAKARLAGAEARSLAPFMAGFTGARHLFDFVDAGDSDDSTFIKIKQTFDLFVDNEQCQHIVFAACHDIRHISALEPHGRSSKITLVKGPNLARDFHRLGLSMTDFSKVLAVKSLSSRIPDARPSQRAFRAAMNGTHRPNGAHPTSEHDKLGSHIRARDGLGKLRAPREDKFTDLTDREDGHNKSSTRRHTSLPTEHEPTPRRNYPVSGYHGNVQAQLLLESEQETLTKIPLNADDQRLDYHLDKPSAEAISAYHMYNQKSAEKRGKGGLCNDFHLGGACAMTDAECRYDHGPIPPEIKQTMKSIVREHPCLNSQKEGDLCKVASCYRGHICAREGCWGLGGGTGCKIAAHLNGLKPKIARWVDGDEEVSQWEEKVEEGEVARSGDEVTESDDQGSSSEEKVEEGEAARSGDEITESDDQGSRSEEKVEEVVGELPG